MLISYKLCVQFNYIIIFSIFCAILQGLSMKRPLVLGKVNRGLCILESSKPSHFKTPSAISSLGYFPSTWICNQSAHAELSNFVLFLGYSNVDKNILLTKPGHMPSSNMKNICSIYVFSTLSPCDVYSKARQWKLPFPTCSISSKNSIL